MTTEIVAAASASRARPIPPALHQGESATVEHWVPASRALPEFKPGVLYDFECISGMHDILTYEMLLVACEREDTGEPIRPRQPDDPGLTEPLAMRSAWQDDEPTAPRRTQTHWALAWFFIVVSSGLAAIALWQAWPDFWRSL